jgi:retron-type reverse transcriptase
LPLDPASESWHKLPWRKFEQQVYRIQKRIFRAEQRGNVRAVHTLQKLLMKSRSARLIAVRRVTQDNQGKKTAGIDGVKSVHPKQRLAMVDQLHPKRVRRRKPQPVRRIYIPYVDTSFTHKTIGTVASRQQAATTRPLTSSIQPCGPKARVRGILVCCSVWPSLSLFECNG